jgi:hypothetical protein
MVYCSSNHPELGGGVSDLPFILVRSGVLTSHCWSKLFGVVYVMMIVAPSRAF